MASHKDEEWVEISTQNIESPTDNNIPLEQNDQSDRSESENTVVIHSSCDESSDTNSASDCSSNDTTDDDTTVDDTTDTDDDYDSNYDRFRDEFSNSAEHMPSNCLNHDCVSCNPNQNAVARTTMNIIVYYLLWVLSISFVYTVCCLIEAIRTQREYNSLSYALQQEYHYHEIHYSEPQYTIYYY